MNFLYSLFYLVGLLCFVFVSALVISILCIAIFDYNRLKQMYGRITQQRMVQNDVDIIDGVFLYSLLFVLVVTLCVKLLFLLNLKEINLSFFYITMFTVILCTFLIHLNISLITKKTFYGKICKICPVSCRIDKIHMVFNVLLILVFTIGIYISNNNRDSYNKNNI